MAAGPIYVEILVRAPLEELWTKTQQRAAARGPPPGGSPRVALRGAALREGFEPAAELLCVAAQIVEPRERSQTLQAENAFEQGRHAIAHRSEVAAARFRDQAPLDQARHHRVDRDPAPPCDLRARARSEIRDHGQRLECRMGQAALDRALEEPAAGLRRFTRRAERPAAGDVLEHDAAPALAVPLPEQAQGRLDPLHVVTGRFGELVRRERLRRHDEQRLDRPCQRVERVRLDQAERALHTATSSTATSRDTRIGANGAACSSETSPARRNSSSARKATACSTRDKPATSWSKSKRARRPSTARKDRKSVV